MSNSQLSWIMDVPEADFEQKVVEASKEKPVVVDFWAPWCAPCRQLAPILEKVVNEKNGEVLLAKVNTDENQSIAAQLRIESLPTVLAFRDGQAIDGFAGFYPEESLRDFVAKLMPTETDNLVQQAKALEESDPQQAEQLYRQALAAADGLEKAQIGLARVLAAQEKHDEAENILDNLVVNGEAAEEVERIKGAMALRELAAGLSDEKTLRQRVADEPDNAQARFEFGCRLAAKGNYKDALEMLLCAGERDHQLATSKVRETMVRIFHVVGNQTELANEFRRRLTSILY